MVDPLIIMAIFALFILILYVVSPLISPPKLKCNGKHVLITGGSQGIGKCIAIEAAKRGANVTILARNQAKLAEAKKHIEKHIKDSEKQKVVCISVDLSKEFTAVDRAIKQAEEQQGPVDILINNAGVSVSARFEDTDIQDFKRLMDVNYIGGVYATRSVFLGMKKRNQGRVVFVSSQAGQLGLFGYSAYSATKFALRGFAESLQMEAKPYNIRVCLAFPPDTLTDSYLEENKSKPKETKLISETSGLFHPDVVATSILDDTEHGKFLCCIGLDGYMLASLTCGMAPIISIMEATQQVVTVGLFRVVALFYLDYFDRTIKECKEERDKKEKKQKDHAHKE